jgi:2-polyprenyl-6-methoxyphenol hydroxylase-like FAD-dependent oxidoreductase
MILNPFHNLVLIESCSWEMQRTLQRLIEDAIVIAQCLAKEDGYRNAFEAFQRRRIPRTKWITETSWQIGKLAQLEGTVLSSIRNFLLRLIPASINEKQLKKLATVDFRKDSD